MSLQSSFTHRYALRLSYHGANFLGWQRQAAGRTVQECLESALATWLRSDAEVVGVGRTDSGVHALNYIAHFDTNSAVDCSEMVFRMNRFLPDDLVLFEAVPVTMDFHARFSALSRAYQYRIQRSKVVFGRETAWQLDRTLNVQLLHQMAASIVGTHHFGAFERSGSAPTNGMCSISHAQWNVLGEDLLFEIEGSRFLRNMVRALVGTMIEQAIADRGMEAWETLRQGQKRTDSGPSAPAQGLTFAGAAFAECLFDGREKPQFIPKR